jgi:MerR family transcriptional regulator/heat shock protein HspR
VSPRKKAGHVIGAVSVTYGIHPQTLRLYERQGLLKPSRSQGNTRLYTDRDLERLEVILTLTRDLGVNLAGVEVVLNMREKMERMQKEIEELVEFVREHVGEVPDSGGHGGLVRVPATQIIRSRMVKK